MEGEVNKEVFRRLIEEGFSRGDTAVVDELLADDHVDHQPGISPGNREGVKRAISFLHRLAPDFSLEVEAISADGDLVWGRLTGRGTHTGPGIGEPTGRSWEITVIDVCRFRDGRVVEHWGVADRFVQMQQLGLIPGGAPAAAHA